MIEQFDHSRKDRKFLDLAYKLAATSECEQKHGAVIVKSGRVMALGVNKNRNNPVFVASDTGPFERGTIFSTHAEVDALGRVRDARGATVYVARQSRTGSEALSRPCEVCTIKLIQAGVKAVVYTI